MSRSSRKTLAIPHPIRDALEKQREAGILDYNSENSMWLGMGLYQLFVGKDHPVTAPIMKMCQEDQDLIFDWVAAKSEEGAFLKGSYLERVISDTLEGKVRPSHEDVMRILPDEVLLLAKEWKAEQP